MTGRGRPKEALLLSGSERTALRHLAETAPFNEVGRRARIVLECDGGRSNVDVAGRLGVSPATVGKWRLRFLRLGVAGLSDTPRSGRRRSAGRTAAVRALTDPSSGEGRADRLLSTRELAQRHGISQATAARLRAEFVAWSPGYTRPRTRGPASAPAASSVADPPARELLSERLYAVLRRQIVSGELAPGQRVVESEIARLTGTSQAPAREAIRRLAHEGLVTHRPHLGNFVAAVSHSQAREAREVRVLIESAAARRAAVQLSAADVTELRAAVARMIRSARFGDVGAFREADMAFHRQVCAASGNSVLLRAWQGLEPTLWSLQVVSDALFDGDRELMARCHDPLIEALESGDPDEAARMFTAHARGEGSRLRRSGVASKAVRRDA